MEDALRAGIHGGVARNRLCDEVVLLHHVDFDVVEGEVRGVAVGEGTDPDVIATFRDGFGIIGLDFLPNDD